MYILPQTDALDMCGSVSRGLCGVGGGPARPNMATGLLRLSHRRPRENKRGRVGFHVVWKYILADAVPASELGSAQIHFDAEYARSEFGPSSECLRHRHLFRDKHRRL